MTDTVSSSPRAHKRIVGKATAGVMNYMKKGPNVDGNTSKASSIRCGVGRGAEK